jgi:hypothetical protein
MAIVITLNYTWIPHAKDMIHVTPNPDYTEVMYEILAGMASGLPTYLGSQLG